MRRVVAGQGKGETRGRVMAEELWRAAVLREARCLELGFPSLMEAVMETPIRTSPRFKNSQCGRSSDGNSASASAAGGKICYFEYVRTSDLNLRNCLPRVASWDNKNLSKARKLDKLNEYSSSYGKLPMRDRKSTPFFNGSSANFSEEIYHSDDLEGFVNTLALGDAQLNVATEICGPSGRVEQNQCKTRSMGFPSVGTSENDLSQETSFTNSDSSDNTESSSDKSVDTTENFEVSTSSEFDLECKGGHIIQSQKSTDADVLFSESNVDHAVQLHGNEAINVQTLLHSLWSSSIVLKEFPEVKSLPIFEDNVIYVISSCGVVHKFDEILEDTIADEIVDNFGFMHPEPSEKRKSLEEAVAIRGFFVSFQHFASSMNVLGKVDVFVMSVFVEAFNLDQEEHHDSKKRVFLAPIFSDKLMRKNLSTAEMKDSLKVLIDPVLTEMVFIPCCKNDHWFLVCVNFPTEMFDIFDLIFGENNINESVYSVVANFKSVFHEAFPWCSKYDVLNFDMRVMDCPKQKGSTNCGIYVFKFMQSWDGRTLIHIDADRVRTIREKLAFYLLTHRHNSVRHPNIKSILDRIFNFLSGSSDISSPSSASYNLGLVLLIFLFIACGDSSVLSILFIYLQY
ncbi:hypothetical protein ABZP36_027275 [Zizania latifolia]